MADTASPLIKEIVEIHSGYSNAVDIERSMLDDTANVGRMSSYRPIASHRRAFERMARSLLLRDKRCYLLTGPYGAGKSHLCLMFANYLRTPANEQPMPSFFENYASVDEIAAEELRARRKGGRYLVALCEWGGKGDFDEVVLRAVDEALKREEFGEELDTPYLQALAKLDSWQAMSQEGGEKGRFHAEFERLLQERHAGLTPGQFRKRLAQFDHSALQDFKAVHQEITTAPFTYDKADLIAVLTSTLASEKFKERFLGMLVLFDEFGYTLEQGSLHPKPFQRFAQLAAETPNNCARLIFVGTAHKELADYAKAYTQTDFRTASDRIESVPLGMEGIEDMIGAIVEPLKDKPLWQERVASRAAVFDKLLADCQRMKIFAGLKAPKIRETVIENIYPMHPVATHCLIQLAQDIASNNRSVYTFFGGEVGEDAEEGSYGHYVATTPIESGGKLNLYTADRLHDYFAATLKSDNKELRDTIREAIKNYESSLRELNRVASQDASSRLQFGEDTLVDRILRLILVYDIVLIPTTQENILFGLYCTTQAERGAAEARLKELAQKGILYYVKETQVYEFKKSTAVDLDSRIEEYKRNEHNVPQNLVAELNALVPLGRDAYLEAKDYNLPFSEDKRLERRIVRPADLFEETTTPAGVKTYFDRLEAEIDAHGARDGEYEGIALYVACETPEDIGKARNACARNTSKRIVVALPRQHARPLLDTIMELRALLFIEASEEARTFSMQDNAALSARLNGDGTRPGAKEALRTLRDRLMSNKEVIWHGPYAATIPTEDTKPYAAANHVMELLYSQHRNKFAHDDFNKLHLDLEKLKSPALREAVEEILNNTEPIVIDTSFAQARGDKRYLEKCLLNNGVLRQVKAEGTRLRCQFETDRTKYAAKLPTLAEMVREISELGDGGKIRIAQWVARYRRPPYGQGPVSLAISLACVLHIFGDSIRIKEEEASLGDMPVQEFEQVKRLVEGRYPQATLSYRKLRKEERELVQTLYGVFGAPGAAASRQYTLGEAHMALKNWWNALPPLARVASLYGREQRPYTADFIEVMQRVEGTDPHYFLLDVLPTALGVGSGLAITPQTVELLGAALPGEKQTLDAALSGVQTRIMDEVRSIFGIEASTYRDLLEGVRDWYNSLDKRQRDAYATWQSNDSRALMLHVEKMDTPDDTFFTLIPGSKEYGLKPVREWVVDHTSEYVERLRAGKALVDANRQKVEAARREIAGAYSLQGEGTVMFRDSVRLTFQHPDKEAKVYVAEGNADPTDAGAPRHVLEAGESLEVRDNKVVRVAVEDAEGNWSPVERIELINEHKKYEIQLPAQISMGDQPVNFVFPVDLESFEVTCRSLFKLSVERNVVPPEDLAARVEAIMAGLRREAQ